LLQFLHLQPESHLEPTYNIM